MNETQERFGNVSDLTMHRRSLLKSGGVLAALFAVSGKVSAFQDTTSPDIVFDGHVVHLPFWQIGSERFTLSGRFGLAEDGVLTGAATMTFPDGSKGTMEADASTATVVYASGRLDYEIDPQQNDRVLVRVNNGDWEDVSVLLTRLEAENRGTGSATLSDVGRATLVVGASAAVFEDLSPA